MKKIMLLSLFLLTSCANSKLHQSNVILPEPQKPTIHHIEWKETKVKNINYFLLDEKNMNILNTNLIDILDYQRKQSSLIHYYENLNK